MFQLIRHLLFVIFVVLQFVCNNTILIAQTNDDYVKTDKPTPTPKENPWDKIKEKLYTGGNIGMQFGTITFVNLSPLLGYKANQYLTAGVGGTYNYISFNNTYPSAVQNHIYGGRAFIRSFPLRNIFLHTEYEALNSNWDVTGRRFFIYNLLAGVGYNYQVGERAFANVTALWNLLPSKYAIYTNPVIRVGFTIGI